MKSNLAERLKQHFDNEADLIKEMTDGSHTREEIKEASAAILEHPHTKWVKANLPDLYNSYIAQ